MRLISSGFSIGTNFNSILTSLIFKIYEAILNPLYISRPYHWVYFDFLENDRSFFTQPDSTLDDPVKDPNVNHGESRPSDDQPNSKCSHDQKRSQTVPQERKPKCPDLPIKMTFIERACYIFPLYIIYNSRGNPREKSKETHPKQDIDNDRKKARVLFPLGIRRKLCRRGICWF